MYRIRQFLSGSAFLLLAAFAQVAVAAEDEFALGEMTLGKPDAPVKVVEYASMTCPHCASFHADTFKAFKEKYIDTGKVQFEFREFPFDRLGLYAAMVARCGGEKRFFGMLDLLFRQQSHWARAEDPQEELRKLARLAGISSQRFDACWNSQALGDAVVKSRMQGQEAHKIESTPSFLVNGDKYAGALTLEEFDKILAKYLPES